MNKSIHQIALILGTRPEAIKLAPVILSLKKDRRFKCKVIATAQHREMLDQVLEVFGLKPDIDLNLMEKDQSLAGFASKALLALDECFKKEKPDMVIVQGDTTTTWVASLSAFYNKIRIGHVEAGLRTGNKYLPFPEEINRVLTTRLADLHFAPTKCAKDNLLKEGIPESKIYITGNTVIDALYIALKKVRSPSYYPGFLHYHPELVSESKKSRLKLHPFVLITGHRRENFGKGFQNICFAIKALAKKFPDHFFIYPVHLNPNVRKPVMKILKGQSNIILTEHMDYLTFVWLMDHCKLILTDSGGIQEEAPSLGKPVIVMRDTTERPEAIQAGSAMLVGTHLKKIVDKASRLLTDKVAYDLMAHIKNPYGNGHAAGHIVNVCAQFLENV